MNEAWELPLCLKQDFLLAFGSNSQVLNFVSLGFPQEKDQLVLGWFHSFIQSALLELK